MAPKHPAQLLFSDKHPLTAVLDMEFEGVEDHVLTVSVKAPASFADADGKHVHTGFTTLFLDTVMGACAIGELKQMVPIATVKLSCSHLSKMVVGEAIICRAKFDSEENGLAYVSAEILAGPDKKLRARAIGTFMIGTATKRLEAKP